MEETKEKKSTKKIDTWEYKAKHSKRYPCVWFDKEKGYERELRYATNQKSIFVDEQKGAATLKHIVFESGHLLVKKEKRNLQEFLEKHPHKGVLFEEFDAVAEAEDQYDTLEIEIAAMNTAYNMEIDQAEAILRVEQGSDVNKLTSKELKRDLLLFAKRQPKLFLDLSEDENIELRNFGIKSVEAGIILLDPTQRTFKWASNGKKLMTIPFEEHPYSALAAWFKTDEGLEVYKSIQKKLK
jgi:hypothetical protein